MTVGTLSAAPFMGSLASVLVTRLPEGEQVVFGRSRCDICRNTLGVLDVIPLVSYVVLRGRCRFCAGKISPVHPVLEIGAIVVAIWAAATFDSALLVVSALLGWALLALAAMDYRRYFLSDYLTLPLIPAGIGVNAWMPGGDPAGAAFGAALGFGLILAVALAFEKYRGMPGIGMGDAKLFAAAGAWVAWTGLGSVLLIAVAVAAILAILLRRRPGELNWRMAVPFGPGLCLGFWLTWAHGPLTLSEI